MTKRSNFAADASAADFDLFTEQISQGENVFAGLYPAHASAPVAGYRLQPQHVHQCADFQMLSSYIYTVYNSVIYKSFQITNIFNNIIYIQTKYLVVL